MFESGWQPAAKQFGSTSNSSAPWPRWTGQTTAARRLRDRLGGARPVQPACAGGGRVRRGRAARAAIVTGSWRWWLSGLALPGEELETATGFSTAVVAQNVRG